MAKLVFIGEKFGGRVYEFAVERTTVGRGAENTLSIQDNSVSHAHCEIFVYNEDVIVRDLGSSNGTFVNGERLYKQQRPLKAGHIVKFGAVEARLELAPGSGADTVTDLTAIHSFDRNREAPEKATPPAPAVAPIGSALPAPTEHTMMLSRTSEVQPPPSLPERNPNIPKWMIVLLILDLAILALEHFK
jgi:pSer/pThr/pTyr-binding forkhead associated (FHA) protein